MRGLSADTDTGAENGKLHQGPHNGLCPTRTAASPNGVKHTPPNCLTVGGVTIVTPETITEAAPSGQGSVIDVLQAQLSSIADTLAGLTTGTTTSTTTPKGSNRGKPKVVPQPSAEEPKAKAEAKLRMLGEAKTQPNGAWFEPLANGLTAYGFVTALAKLNKNYGRIEFTIPSSIDDGNQILHNGSPHSVHNATLGEAKVGQHYQNFSWPGLDVNIYDVLSELDGWDRSLLPENIG